MFLSIAPKILRNLIIKTRNSRFCILRIAKHQVNMKLDIRESEFMTILLLRIAILPLAITQE